MVKWTWKTLSHVLLFTTPWTPPGSSVHGILQARILKWVVLSFSRGSSQSRDWTWVSYLARVPTPVFLGFTGASTGRESTCSVVWPLGWEDPLEMGMATHCSNLDWRIPWTVQSMGSQRVGHDWATFTFTPALQADSLPSVTREAQCFMVKMVKSHDKLDFLKSFKSWNKKTDLFCH